MSEVKKYIYNKGAVLSSDSFLDASAEELRALICIIESDQAPVSVEELAARAKISRPRAMAAIALWRDSNVISENSGEPRITEEFDSRIRSGEISARPSIDVAATIRNETLADMLAECARLINRPALNTEEIKELTALYDQYSLSEEYILTLLTFLTHGGEKRVAVRTLINAAIKYSTEMDINTVEALEDYIKERENEGTAAKEFRKIFGIYDRALSKTETECFKKWSKEYGYFTDIVGEAYDIAVTGGYKKLVLQADKLLTRWHETGCRTVADCRARYEQDTEEKKAQREAERKEKKSQEKPRDKYSDFDPEEAFRLALERSFGPSEDTDGDVK